MSRTLVPSGPAMIGRRLVLRLLAAGGDVRPLPDARDVQPGIRVSAIEADHDHGVLDAVAGCEYVDDCIRRRE